MWLHTTTRLVILTAALAAGPAAAADTTTAPGRTAGDPTPALAEDVMGARAIALTFRGVDSDGLSLVWTGALPGANGGTVTLVVTPLCSPAASAEPAWPVRARWVLRAPDGAERTAARLDGIVDWKDRRVHLQGHATRGADAGVQVVVSATLRDLEAEATYTLFQSIAER